LIFFYSLAKVFIYNGVYCVVTAYKVIQETENILVERSIDGDYQSFAKMVDGFKDRVVNICYSYTNNLADAEDIAQEVFVELFKSLNGFKREAALSTWIYRIASNKSIDFLRKQKRIKRGSGLVSYLDDHKNAAWASNNGSSADEEIIQQQRKELLYWGLGKLPIRQKEAFVLTQIEGFDQQTAAGILKTSVKSVESLIVRAKKKLKQLLEKQIKDYL
jgi:RNA polymerase sigma-70 factor (ECF subfamily)